MLTNMRDQSPITQLKIDSKQSGNSGTLLSQFLMIEVSCTDAQTHTDVQISLHLWCCVLPLHVIYGCRPIQKTSCVALSWVTV